VNIHLSFVDVDTGTVFAQSDVPPEQLPDTFEAHTTVGIEGQEWEVLAADPMTRDGAMESGALRVALRKLTIADLPPGEILYSLPTLCDAVPPVTRGSSKLAKSVLEIEEDEWRQIELVSARFHEPVRAAFAQIARIYEGAAAPGGGFRELHVRTELPAPLGRATLYLDAVRTALSPFQTVFAGLAYPGIDGLVDGGFAFRTAGGLSIYGTQRARLVTAVGLVLDHPAGVVDAEARRLSELLRDHDLVLVDWCRMRVARDEDQIRDYLHATIKDPDNG
jgi:hypothetical protein